MAQMEFARNVIFRRRARLHELFQRAIEIGVALGGATQTRHIFGRRISRRYDGKLETTLERRDEGFPVLRAYYKSSYVKQYEKGDRLLRTETCLNDTYHLGIGRKLHNLPAVQQRLAATTDRYLAQQAELLDSTVDTGALARLTSPITTAARRVPGIKLHDDRVIRLLETLLHSGGLVGDWTTRDLHAHVLSRHRLGEQDYTLGQLRYDLGKLRAHGLAARLGTSRRYRLSRDGVRLGALLVKVRTRLLGPIFCRRHRARQWPQRQPQRCGRSPPRCRPSSRRPLCDARPPRRRLSRRPYFVTQTTFITVDTYTTRVNRILGTSGLGS